MPSCVVTGCKMGYGSGKLPPGIAFHAFPIADKSRLKIWVEAVGRTQWTPTKNARICSLHFLEADYQTRASNGTCLIRRKLKQDAVPLSIGVDGDLNSNSESFSGAEKPDTQFIEAAVNAIKTKGLKRSGHTKTNQAVKSDPVDPLSTAEERLKPTDITDNLEHDELISISEQTEVGISLEDVHLLDCSVPAEFRHVQPEDFEEDYISNRRIKELFTILYKMDESKDLTIVCDEGRACVRMHSTMFACMSQFARDLLISANCNCCSESDRISIYLPDYPVQVVEALVHRCYALETDLDVDSEALMKSLWMEMKLIETPMVWLETPDSGRPDYPKVESGLGTEANRKGEGDFSQKMTVQLSESVKMELEECFEDEDMTLLTHLDTSEEKASVEGVASGRAANRSKARGTRPNGDNWTSSSEGSLSKICHYCGDQFDDPLKLKYHLFKEVNYYPFTCSVNGCDFGAFFKSAITRHVSAVHQNVADELQENLQQCETCRRRVRDLKRHKARFHDPTNPIVCDKCQCRFAGDKPLRRHQKLQHEERRHKCKCGASFGREINLLRHIRYVCSLPTKDGAEKRFPVKCGLCWYRTRDKRAMSVHMAKHHRDKKYVCECGKTFSSVEVLRKHVRRTCPKVRGDDQALDRMLKQCDKCHKKVLCLEEHHDREHDEQLPFGCSLCFWRTGSLRRLRFHMTNVHTERKHSCEDCGKMFPSVTAMRNHHLNQHQTTSSRVVETTCDLCGFLANGAHSLSIHKAAAHSKKRHHCKCGSSFTNSKNLHKHMRDKCVRSKEFLDAWVKCSLCPFKGKDSRTVLMHEGKYHNNAKKHVCDCGVKFTRREALASHQKKNCILNEHRENEVIHCNSYQPAKKPPDQIFSQAPVVVAFKGASAELVKSELIPLGNVFSLTSARCQQIQDVGQVVIDPRLQFLPLSTIEIGVEEDTQ